MNRLKSIILTLPVLGLLLLGSFSAIAYAEGGSSGGGSGSGGNDSGLESNDPNVNDNPKQGRSDVKQSGADGQETTETETQNQSEAKALLQDLRKAHKEHTEAERQKNCQAAEHGLETKLTNLGRNAAAYQARIDKILAKAQSFQTTNNVTVANWDQLLAAAQAAQTKAASSVAALQALNVNLDCASPSVADNVATFRTAAQQARTDMQSYKQAVKDLLKALKAAVEAQNQQTGAQSQGGTQ